MGRNDGDLAKGVVDTRQKAGNQGKLIHSLPRSFSADIPSS
jgi:hypothetical protein